MNEFVYQPLDENDVNIHQNENAQFIPPTGGCTVSEARKDQEDKKLDDLGESVDEKIHKCLEKLRPYLQRDGGDLQYIGIENKWVNIKMLGNCNGCGSVGMSLVEIEEFLLEEVQGIKGISWKVE